MFWRKKAKPQYASETHRYYWDLWKKSGYGHKFEFMGIEFTIIHGHVMDPRIPLDPISFITAAYVDNKGKVRKISFTMDAANAMGFLDKPIDEDAEF